MNHIKVAFETAPVVPVLTIGDAGQAGKLATVLAAAGLTAVEVTLRTDAALDAIANMKTAAPDLLVGAGTILNPDDLDSALKAGSDFLVSPGLPAKLRDAVVANDAVMIPGVATPTEAMQRYDEGFAMLKLFPAGVVGGVSMLSALAGPLPQLRFMPTGGVSAANLADYIKLPNVAAVGGTWLAREADLNADDWDGIEQRSREALTLALAAA